MAYYTALTTAWNGATQPPTGVTGTGLTGGMTTAQKLAAVNAWTVTGSVPTSFFTTGADLLNAIDWTEFNALTAANQTRLLAMLAVQGPLLGGSANTSHMVPGMFLALFTNLSGPTIVALTALAKAVVLPWWQASNGGGLSSPVSQQDLTAAGGLT